jgi:hypothetical protein
MEEYFYRNVILPYYENFYEPYNESIYQNWEQFYHQNMHSSKYFDQLISINDCITFDFIKKHPEIKWDMFFVSKNPNMNIKIVLANPDFPWDVRGLTQNLSITIKDMIENPQISWDFNSAAAISRKDLTMDYINKIGINNIDIHYLSSNSSITFEDIKNNSHIQWEGNMLINRMNYTLEELATQTIFKFNDYRNITLNKNLHIQDFIKFRKSSLFAKSDPKLQKIVAWKVDRYNKCKEFGSHDEINWKEIRKTLSVKGDYKSLLKNDNMTYSDILELIEFYSTCGIPKKKTFDHVFKLFICDNNSLTMQQSLGIIENLDDTNNKIDRDTLIVLAKKDYYYHNFYELHSERLSKASSRLAVYEKELIEKSCVTSRILNWNTNTIELFPEWYKRECDWWINTTTEELINLIKNGYRIIQHPDKAILPII